MDTCDSHSRCHSWRCRRNRLYTRHNWTRLCCVDNSVGKHFQSLSFTNAKYNTIFTSSLLPNGGICWSCSTLKQIVLCIWNHSLCQRLPTGSSPWGNLVQPYHRGHYDNSWNIYPFTHVLKRGFHMKGFTVSGYQGVSPSVDLNKSCSLSSDNRQYVRWIERPDSIVKLRNSLYTHQTSPRVRITILGVSMTVTWDTLTKERMSRNVYSVITTSTAL